MRSAAGIISKYPEGVIDLIVIHPLQQRFEWVDIPQSVKQLAEMRTYGIVKEKDAYDLYGVSKAEGAVSIVRPDGYVGTISRLASFHVVEEYFKRTLREV